jgi:hypothetical protein
MREIIHTLNVRKSTETGNTMTMAKVESALMQAVHEAQEHRDCESNLVAVNDNGLRLLEWFRALPQERKIDVVNSVSAAAKRARH